MAESGEKLRRSVPYAAHLPGGALPYPCGLAFSDRRRRPALRRPSGASDSGPVSPSRPTVSVRWASYSSQNDPRLQPHRDRQARGCTCGPSARRRAPSLAPYRHRRTISAIVLAVLARWLVRAIDTPASPGGDRSGGRSPHSLDWSAALRRATQRLARGRASSLRRTRRGAVSRGGRPAARDHGGRPLPNHPPGRSPAGPDHDVHTIHPGTREVSGVADPRTRGGLHGTAVTHAIPAVPKPGGRDRVPVLARVNFRRGTVPWCKVTASVSAASREPPSRLPAPALLSRPNRALSA